MATLIVRDLDDRVAQRLREQAARNGHSMAEEVRQLVRQAVSGGARGDVHRLAAKLRTITAGRRHTPAEALIREGRNQR